MTDAAATADGWDGVDRIFQGLPDFDPPVGLLARCLETTPGRTPSDRASSVTPRRRPLLLAAAVVAALIAGLWLTRDHMAYAIEDTLRAIAAAKVVHQKDAAEGFETGQPVVGREMMEAWAQPGVGSRVEARDDRGGLALSVDDGHTLWRFAERDDQVQSSPSGIAPTWRAVPALRSFELQFAAQGAEFETRRVDVAGRSYVRLTSPTTEGGRVVAYVDADTKLVTAVESYDAAGQLRRSARLEYGTPPPQGTFGLPPALRARAEEKAPPAPAPAEQPPRPEAARPVAAAAPAKPPAASAREVAAPPMILVPPSRTDAMLRGMDAIDRPGVEVFYPAPVLGEDPRLGLIADIVAVAKKTDEQLFPESALEQIRVLVVPSEGWYESTLTDRRDLVVVHLGDKGWGEAFRADAGPVGLLCQAVAELHNPRRIPGLDRYIAQRYLAPAVFDELGPTVPPSPHKTPLADDGLAMLQLMTDPAYASVHPDFAAAAALMAIDDHLGSDGLRALLDALPSGSPAGRADAPDPFDALPKAAVAKDWTLDAAFQSYDEATRLDLQPDGTCLVASFEADEGVRRAISHPFATLRDPVVLTISDGFTMTTSDEWATDGALSLKLEAEHPGFWANAGIIDPDWKFKDWRRFSRFEVDLKLVSPEPHELSIRLHDDVAHKHGEVVLWSGKLQPGEARHIACALNPVSLRGYSSPHTEYFFPPFRAGEVAHLMILFHTTDADTPVTLYVDNIRLTPRAPGEGSALALPEGAAKEASPAFPAHDQERARGIYRAGMAHQRAGRSAEAIDAFLAAIAADPQCADAYWALAWAYAEVGERQKAVEAFGAVAQTDPDPQRVKAATEAMQRLRNK